MKEPSRKSVIYRERDRFSFREAFVKADFIDFYQQYQGVLEAGHSATAFSFPGTDGDEIRDYQLSDHTDEEVTILLFYPFDQSDLYRRTVQDTGPRLLFTEGVDVFGVSAENHRLRPVYLAVELDTEDLERGEE